MSAAASVSPVGVPNGPMSEQEVVFCRQVRELIAGAIDGRVPFVGVASNLVADLRTIRRSGFDVDVAVSAGFRASIAQPLLLRSLPAGRATLSPDERAFLLDVDGFLDFALRNGMTFPGVLSLLLHDFGEIAAHEFSLAGLAQDFIRPKASGWAKRNVDPVGEPEEME